MQKKVEYISDEAYKFRESGAEKSKAILEEGLRRYLDNDILLNNPLYVMNYSEKPDETIAVAEKFIEHTDQSDVRYDALRFLAYAYNAKSDIKSAEAAIEQIPEIYFK